MAASDVRQITELRLRPRRELLALLLGEAAQVFGQRHGAELSVSLNPSSIAFRKAPISRTANG